MKAETEVLFQCSLMLFSLQLLTSATDVKTSQLQLIISYAEILVYRTIFCPVINFTQRNWIVGCISISSETSKPKRLPEEREKLDSSVQPSLLYKMYLKYCWEYNLLRFICWCTDWLAFSYYIYLNGKMHNVVKLAHCMVTFTIL